MKLLLDTHVFLWWAAGDPRVSPKAAYALEDMSNELFFSAASVWEMAIKVSVGKLQLVGPAHEVIPRYLAIGGVQSTATLRGQARVHLLAALPRHHNYPFDRMLIAQAQIEGLTLLSSDAMFSRYDVQLLW